MLLRELTEDTGLAEGWTEALLDTYKAHPVVHLPGRVLADLAVMIADGGDTLSHLATLREQHKLFGTVASEATAWRCVERVDDERLARLQTARAEAREGAWAAGAGPDLQGGLTIDIDATITIAHSEKENAASAPGKKRSPKVLIRTDSAGATYGFAAACHAAGCGFSFGFAIDEPVRAAILTLRKRAWTAAYDINGEPRDGAWVAELTGLLDLSKWPKGSRVLVRRERPHPGAQLRFADADGHRFTAFITDTPRGGPHRQHADLEVRHRSHARVEDRIRCGKATGLRNLPCKTYAMNKVWLELALSAADLLSWTQKICLTGELARCEPAALRYRLLHVAARLVRTGRSCHLKIDRDWPWATHLATAFARLRAARWPT